MSPMDSNSSIRNVKSLLCLTGNTSGEVLYIIRIQNTWINGKINCPKMRSCNAPSHFTVLMWIICEESVCLGYFSIANLN